MVYGVIYKIKNKINGKVYIGQTINSFDKRYNNDLLKNTHNEHLRNSIVKYGIDNFDIDKKLDVGHSLEELNQLEEKYIFLYKSNDSKYGYNKNTGGDSRIPSEESRKKMSKAKKGDKHPKINKYIIQEGDDYIYIDRSIAYNPSLSVVLFYINSKENRRGYAEVSIRELIEYCGIKARKGTDGSINRFREILIDLVDLGYVLNLNNVDIQEVKPTEILKLECNNLFANEFLKIDIEEVDKIMSASNVDNINLFKMYCYFILESINYRLVNSIKDISCRVGMNDNTVGKYIKTLLDLKTISIADN